MSPMRLILSDAFFNQYEKFLVAGRANQWRLGRAAPGNRFKVRDKFFQLPQNALMNGGIGDHTFAFIRLLFSGFEKFFRLQSPCFNPKAK